MTYGQLLRRIALLTEEQLKKEINIRIPMDTGRWTIERVTVWDDGHEDYVDAGVDIFITTK